MTTTQPVIRFDLDRDVRTAEAMASRLTPYIYEDEVYGSMPGDLPKLTLGGLLMRLHRLSAVANLLAPQQQAALQKAQADLDKVRQEWPTAYEKKLQRELKVRITALEQFLAECGENARGCADNYPSNIEKRVMAEDLTDEADSRSALPPELKSGLTSVDGKLRRYVKPGEFIWDKRLEPAYPRDKYWFLYVSPVG
jgi:hypothetical protein